MQQVLFNTCGDMKRMFLEKFFLVSRTTSIRKEICGIRQHTNSTSCVKPCPYHQISEQLLIQYFYEGLVLMDKSIIDAASGATLMDKTPTTTRNLISNMTSNTYQFGVRRSTTSKVVNEVVVVDNQRLENKIIELTSLVRQLAIGQHHTTPLTKACGICTSTEHPTNACPTLQETKPNSVRTDPKAILKLEIRFYAKHNSKPTKIPTTSSQISSTILQTTTTNGNKQYAISIKCECHNLGLANTNWIIIHHYELIAIKWFWTSPFSNNRQYKRECEHHNFDEWKGVTTTLLKELCTYKRNKLKEDVEMGRNVPALIKSEQVFALIQPTMPKKCRNLDTFTVPCTIGECTFAYAMLDLGTLINVMPSSIYKLLNFGDLEPIGVIIQLANRSFAHPLGILEDVLV
ncbi:hypothetical protein CR513_14776, partial [Mucuna pruriens]